MHLTTIELSQTDTLIAIDGLEQETTQQLDSVGTLLIDIVARVTTYQALQLGTHKEIACRNLCTLEGKLGSSITATST